MIWIFVAAAAVFVVVFMISCHKVNSPQICRYTDEDDNIPGRYICTLTGNTCDKHSTHERKEGD